MAVNDPSAYGRDIACLDDADDLFSDAVGLDVVRQDAYHRLTNDSVIGPGGDDWGYDVTKLVGMPATTIASLPPTLSAVLQRDPRIEAADVTIRPQPQGAGGTYDVQLEVNCLTKLGPFDLVLGINDLTVDILEGQ